MANNIPLLSCVKMQYSIILLSLVTFCYSVPIAIEKNKHITLEADDKITIDGTQGKKVEISRAEESSGQRNVAIFMEDNSGPIVKTWFKQQSDMVDTKVEPKEVTTEMDILIAIFKEYQGDIDDVTYENILQQIRQFVRTGQVDVNVLNILRSFTSEEDQDDVSTDMRKSLSSDSLKKLLRTIKSLGMIADAADIDRLIRRNPIFISRIAGQEPINTADIVYLNNLLMNRQIDPLEMQQRQAMMGLENPMIAQDSGMTRKDIMDMQLMKQMQDPRFQRIFMTPNSMVDYDTMSPDMDSTMKMRYGMVMDDPLDQVVSGEKTFMMMKEMDPETLDENMTTRQWLRLVQQMEQEKMMKRLWEWKIRQMIMQQRNRWQGRNMSNTPRTMMDQKNRMIMDRMMPMV